MFPPALLVWSFTILTFLQRRNLPTWEPGKDPCNKFNPSPELSYQSSIAVNGQPEQEVLVKCWWKLTLSAIPRLSKASDGGITLTQPPFPTPSQDLNKAKGSPSAQSPILVWGLELLDHGLPLQRSVDINNFLNKWRLYSIVGDRRLDIFGTVRTISVARIFSGWNFFNLKMFC